MIAKYFFQLLFLYLMFTLTGCSKDTKTTESQIKVSFTNPANGAVYKESDTLWFTVQLSSIDGLHDFVVQLTNLTESTTAYTHNGHSHENKATVTFYYLPNINADAQMELSVLTLDHNGVQKKDAIVFTILNTVLARKPSIDIVSPTSFSFVNGDSVKIRAVVNHNANIQKAELILTAGGKPLFTLLPKTNGTTALFDTTYVIRINVMTDFEMTVSATDVYGENAVVKEGFHVHP